MRTSAPPFYAVGHRGAPERSLTVEGFVPTGARDTYEAGLGEAYELLLAGMVRQAA
jgi:hypothetical protein